MYIIKQYDDFLKLLPYLFICDMKSILKLQTCTIHVHICDLRLGLEGHNCQLVYIIKGGYWMHTY